MIQKYIVDNDCLNAFNNQQLKESNLLYIPEVIYEFEADEQKNIPKHSVIKINKEILSCVKYIVDNFGVLKNTPISMASSEGTGDIFIIATAMALNKEQEYSGETLFEGDISMNSTQWVVVSNDSKVRVICRSLGIMTCLPEEIQ